MVLVAVEIQPGFSPRTPDTGWKPMHATMLSGGSIDLSKCFLRRVPRTHSRHATA